jgi:hypothetical protein
MNDQIKVSIRETEHMSMRWMKEHMNKPGGT